MKTEFFEFAGYWEAKLPACLWVPEGEVKAVLQITHGILSILYPVLVWGGKVAKWWQEEQYLRGRLLATATPLNSAEDVLEPQENNRYDECDW